MRIVNFDARRIDLQRLEAIGASDDRLANLLAQFGHPVVAFEVPAVLRAELCFGDERRVARFYLI